MTAPVVLGAGGREMPGRGGRRRRAALVAALVTAVVLLVGSVAAAVAWAAPGRASTAALGAGSGRMMGGRVATAVPQLAGTTVHVTAVDMGGGMMGGGGMHLALDRSSAPAGSVSLVLTNAGLRTHELVVLPLAADQQPGTRALSADGRVDESGSLGEASRSGGADTGDGIEPGAAGWTTLDLPAGRYELICNMAGHYAAGMFAELTIS